MQPDNGRAAELQTSLPGIGGGSPERLFELLYEQLHGLAGQVRIGRAGATMNTTALVHEAYIKLAAAGDVDLQSRLHFFRLAARAMRQVLVDGARRQLAEKRGGDLVLVTLNDAAHATPMRASTFLALDCAIDRLTELDPRAAQVVECRYFAGLSVEETATALDISPRTVKRDWRVARALLTAELAAEEPG